MHKTHPFRIIRWIISFITLATFFFILPAACVQPPIGDYYRNKGSGGGSTDGDDVMPPAPTPTSITEAPGITSGGFSTSVSVTMSHALTGVTIYYRAASDTTTDLSTAINPTDNTTYTGTGTTASPATFTSPGHVYRIKAVAVATDGRVSPETAIQRFDYDIDSDNDGLIDIRNLEMFSNIRFNLAGTTYDDEALDTGTGDPGITTGGPTVATTACQTDPDGDTVFLCGYELMGNLDFTLASSYASGAVNTTWCPDASNNCVNTTGTGFPGIGAATGTTGGFTGIFHGNDRSISNFYSRNTANTNNANIGLFNLNEGGTIRNITVEANVFGGTATDVIGGLVGWNTGIVDEGSASGSADGGAGDIDRVGGLVGNNVGTITASYAIGDADGGAGITDLVGGLVGWNQGGTITASSATGAVDGGVGGDDRVGGLAGQNNGATARITASYANGDVDGGAGGDFVGGLVGFNESTITASYAIGDADGGSTSGANRVGGLVGSSNGTITASYSTGAVNGGSGGNNEVGGLVGELRFATVTASFSTGAASGGAGTGDTAGRLVGATNTPTINESYGFGMATGNIAGENGSPFPTGVSIATGPRTISVFNTGTTFWNNLNRNTLGTWDYGTLTENLALVYTDYDGTAGTDFASCSDDNGGFPDTIPGTTIPLVCGTTLIGNYRAP